MNTFTNFAEALQDFRLSGGAMNFSAKHFRGESDVWYVGDADEIHEMTEMSPYFATENALSAGGMTPAEIEAELADWEDQQ